MCAVLYNMKKRLSGQQEFEIMKLVLDKILWVGFAAMVFGIYKMAVSSLISGIIWFIVGVVFLILFIIIVVKEYEIIK